jgi:hypothetical protein
MVRRAWMDICDRHMMETHTLSRILDVDEIIGLIRERENFFE